MAEPISKYTDETNSYIKNYGSLAAKYGNAYHVSSYAVMGSIANEYDTRANPDLTFDTRGGFGQWVGDKLVVKWGLGSYTHEDIENFYDELRSGELTTKFRNPTAVDIGPGNIRVSTAIEIVRAYTKEYQGTGQDPLGLLKYSNAYGALINDLLSFDHPDASFAISAAYAKQGELFFMAKDTAAWNRLSSDQKDALLVTYYKLGPESLGNNIDARMASSKQNGERFDFNPNGDGGTQHLNNVSTIKLLMDSNSPCFPAGTPILLSDGTEKLIEDIRPGDKVLAFDGETELGRGVLRPREVVRLLGGVTRDWIRIDFPPSTALPALTLTPNHRVLTPLGTFIEVEKLIEADGSVELVMVHGTLARGQATRIAYAAETAGLYEEAAQLLAPSLARWRSNRNWSRDGGPIISR